MLVGCHYIVFPVIILLKVTNLHSYGKLQQKLDLESQREGFKKATSRMSSSWLQVLSQHGPRLLVYPLKLEADPAVSIKTRIIQK